MRRLKTILRSIENAHVSNYQRIFSVDDDEGPVYYYGDIRFDFEFPPKFEIAKPCINVTIPLSRLGLVLDGSAPESRIAVEDFALRAIEPYVTAKNDQYFNKNKSVAETGAIYIYHPGQEIIERNSVDITDDDTIVIMLQVVLPVYNSGKINGRKAAAILTKDIPESFDRFISEFDLERCRLWRRTAEIQSTIRKYVDLNGFVCFIADGSVLPRAKGTDLPLSTAVPFRTTPEDAIDITLPDGTVIKGMGIKKGVTVITGGGYSGKSTLLDAIEYGVYNHIPGDGREFVVTRDDAIKVYAEDGRPISDLDLSPFIRYLPLGGDQSHFTSHHASGSTSQAANIIEAVNAGARVLLIDEDKSATNFMIRDSLMKKIVRNDPITPFTDRARELYDTLGVSTILVIGGSSEYFSIADNVLLIEDYQAYNQTQMVKEMFDREDDGAQTEPADWLDSRCLSFTQLSMWEQLSVSRLDVSGREYISFADELIDITLLTAIVSKAQATALAQMLRYIRFTNEPMPLSAVVKDVFKRVSELGLDSIYSPSLAGERWLEMPRPLELYALMCRLRTASYSR